MTTEKFQFHITVSLGEFHEIFAALQDKLLANRQEIENLLWTSSPAIDITDIYGANSQPTPENKERAEKLSRENQLINDLLTNIYDQTNQQLGL